MANIDGTDTCCGEMLLNIFTSIRFRDSKLWIESIGADGEIVRGECTFCPFCGKYTKKMVESIKEDN